MPLTDVTVKNAKPKTKAFKLTDGRGMFLLVSPNGSKWWRLKYRIEGKEKSLSFGVYPDVSLKDARIKRDEARALIAEGIDPSQNRKAQKQSSEASGANSFEVVAREWLDKASPRWTSGHEAKVRASLEGNAFPWLGAMPIADIKASELLAVLRRVEARGAVHTAHRVHQQCGKVFRYAIATGRAERDVAADLRGALAKETRSHHASITDTKAIGELLRDIAGYQGMFPTKCALRLAPLVFVRPGELRHAEWSEIDFEKSEWRIPAEKMKMRVVHIVPLSTQAVAILKELYPLTSGGRYVFPSVRTHDRPMSENTVNAGLRGLGYESGEMTGHGFRSMASTLLNEQGWNGDAIERQLAHGERNKVRGAYNYAEYMPERRKMMQAWADYLEALAVGGKVVAGAFGKRVA
jgi:integrase